MAAVENEFLQPVEKRQFIGQTAFRDHDVPEVPLVFGSVIEVVAAKGYVERVCKIVQRNLCRANDRLGKDIVLVKRDFIACGIADE